MAAFLGSYQGKPTIELYEDRGDGKPDRFPMVMGLAKAKKALAHLEELRLFVASEGKTISSDLTAAESVVE